MTREFNLEDAIKHCEEVAEENEKRASWFWGKEGNPNYENCIKCAEEHRQLAEWLRDYKRLKEQEPCNDAISRQAILKNAFKIYTHECGLVEVVGVATIKELPPVKPQEPKTGHWIPVSERLPKAGEYIGDVAKYYLVQNEYGDMLVARYTHGEYWEQIYQLKPIGDEIVAWMPLPKLYEPQESEG